MTNQNELQNVNMINGEISKTDNIVEETGQYVIVKKENGKYEKQMKYEKYHSRIPETEEEMIELYRVFNEENSDLVTPLKNMVGKQLEVAHVFQNPYQSFDENTGESTNGVTTTLQTSDGNYYATSSKSVYYTIRNLFDVFGDPASKNFKPLIVEVTGTKRKNGVQINLSFVKRA